MIKSFRFYSLLLALLFNIQHSFSQTSWKGTVNANWNNALNWTNGIPDNTKDATLGDASFTGIYQPKVNVASICKSVTIGGVIPTTLTITRNLTLSGNLTINTNGIVSHPASAINLNGNWINHGVYITTTTTSRVILTGTAQTISGNSLSTFRKLSINPSSIVTLAANIAVDGSGSLLSISGVIDPGQSPTYTVTSTVSTKINADGKLKINAATFAGNYIFSGAVTFFGGSIAEYSSTTTDQIVSSAYAYSTLIISGTGTKSLAANLPALYGKNSLNGKIYVNSAIFDIGIFTANRATTVAGGEINVAAGALLKIGGASNFPLNFVTRTFSPASTVEYNGGAQSIYPVAYGNLLISTSGIKTAIAPFSVSGNLTMTNGTLNTNANVVNHSIAGNFIMSGGSALSGTASTYTLNGTTDQTINLLSSLVKLTINKTAGAVNLGSDITVTNTLNFTKGNIQTGNNTVIIPSSGTITGASQTTGWVNGNLKKNVATGAGISRSFEIGDATGYLPASVLFASVSTAGDLIAKAGSGDHLELDYSGIDPVKSVNRFWSLINAGILFTNATSTFNWVASDIDGGATTANFKTGAFNGTNWTLTSVASPLPTSIQTTGLTSFGEFAVGEKITKSTWNGNAFSDDWFTAKNWLGGIPTTSVSTLIPNGITGGRFYPVLASGTGTVSDITVENTASLAITGTLQIAGVFTNTGMVTASAGTVEFNGVSPQSIPSGLFSNNTIKNLVINNDVSLADTDTLTGTLTLTSGKTFATGNNLVLKSDANGTARIDALPVDGSGVATAFITGNVSIERYIPARKAWRLLSVPIKASGAVTISQAWQEGAYSSSFAPNPNPTPGYGVHITGGTVANGFDQSPTNSPSIKIYDQSSNSFKGLPATPGTFAPINNYPGYLVYIRGDRSIDLSQGNNAAVTSTTLRMKGSVNTGNQASTVNATNFTVLGNPYPSAIDFQTLTRVNVKNSFYIWDPKLAGSNGLGAYVTVSWNSGTSSYDITSAASPISQYIPSGEAVLVESLDAINPGTITVKETDKSANGSDGLFGRPNGLSQKLRTNLYAVNSDGTSSLLDAALTTYHDNNLNILDQDDVNKINSGSENIGIKRDAKTLAIERRKTITENDTTFLNLSQLKMQMYTLEIITENLDKNGVTGLLKDNYSNTTNNLPLQLNGTTNVTFTANADPASYAANRFSIVFAQKNTMPPAYTSVKAYQQQNDISVEWNVDKEINMKAYEVETSSNGIDFQKAATQLAKGNNGSTANYRWLDVNAAAGIHYYRIRSVTTDAVNNYSASVKVNIDMSNLVEKMTVFPNPVINNVVSLRLPELKKGIYNIQVYNINGQMVKKVFMQHNGGRMIQSFSLDNNLPSGKYQVKLTGESVNLISSMIKE